MRLLTAARKRLIWFFCSFRIRAFEDSARLSLANGCVNAALVVYEKLFHDFQWSSSVEKILFKKNYRPSDPAIQAQLFDGIRRSTTLPAHFVFYANIARIYVALSQDDSDVISESFAWLTDQSLLDHENYRFLLESAYRNRESRFKQIVSARSCLLQCCFCFLSSSGSSPLSSSSMHHISSANLVMMHSISLSALPPDVAVRSVTNLVRGMLPVVVQGPSECYLALEVMLRMQQFLLLPSNRKFLVRAKEDHAAFLEAAIELVQDRLAGKFSECRDVWLQLVLNSDSDTVKAGAEIFWSGSLGS